MTYWPKNVILWGAGATASLGMPTSNHQSSFVTQIANDQDIKRFLLEEDRELLDRDSYTKLKSLLKLVPNRCAHDGSDLPKEGEKLLAIQDVFNLLAIYKKNRRELFVEGCDASLTHNDICQAESLLNELISAYFRKKYAEMLDTKGQALDTYYAIYKTLAEHAMQQKMKAYNEGKDFTTREHGLLDYAFVNFNWDAIILWIIFNVHKELNDTKKYYVGSPAVKLKVFNDFSTYLACKRIPKPFDKASGNIWYPYNEAIIQRLNDLEHRYDQRIVLGKFYQPHGSFNWYECPHCGKLNMTMGNKWDIHSETFFPKGKSEDRQCLFCETPIRSDYNIRLVQTPFKDENPPYLEEIQRDMLTCIEHAEHLVFAGFSLPEDDLMYRSIFSARHNPDVKVTILDYDPSKAHEGFLELKSAKNETAYRIASTLGAKEENIRVNFEGIPKVFKSGDSIDKQKVLDIFLRTKTQ